MGNPTSVEKKDAVVRMWVERLMSGRAIAKDKEIDLGFGTVSEILTEARKRDPTLEELRALYTKLKDGRGYTETLRAANYLREFENAGLDQGADAVVDAGRLLKSHPDDSEEAIGAGRAVLELEKSEKRPYKEIAAEAGRLKGEAQKSIEILDSARKQTEEVKKDLGELEEYRRLKKELAELGTDVRGMNGFVSYHKRLKILGFDERSATSLANELDGRGLTPKEGAAVLAEALKSHSTLEASLSDLRGEVKRLEGAVEVLGVEEEGCQKRVAAAQAEVKALSKSADGLKETISTLEATARTLRDALKEISKIAPATAKKIADAAGKGLTGVAASTAKSLDKELRKAVDSVAASVRRLDAAAKNIDLSASKAEEKVDALSGRVVKDMDKVSQRAFDSGRDAERLERVSRAYRFISEGEGDRDFVFPTAMEFLKSFEGWEDARGLPTFDLGSAIRETRNNWESHI